MFCHSFPLWLRWGSVATLIASICLLCVALFGRNHQTTIAANLVRLLVVAFCLAVFLNIYSFWHLMREHREADQAFRNADCEFSSIFQNVLDGVLIVDNAGDCLDSNPAAAVILRLPTNKLIGQNITNFLADREGFP